MIGEPLVDAVPERVVVRGLRPAAVAMVVLLLAPLLVVLPQPVAADEDPPQFEAAQDNLAPGLDAAGLGPMSAGFFHTCAIGADGAAYCWGNNDSPDLGGGQLGTGDTEDRSTPTQVTGTTATFTQLTAGAGHTCGLNGDGTAYCWGSNGFGQLGDDDRGNDKSTPTQVTGTTATFTQLTAGGGHTCGLAADGAAYCWGNNDLPDLGGGQLGTGDTEDRSTPTQVTGTTATFTQLTAGDAHTCGLAGDGTAYCWGFNGAGRLGIGETGGERSTPTAVSTGTVATFTQLTAGGNHTCGLGGDGTAYCWGDNENGQLGILIPVTKFTGGEVFPARINNEPTPTPVSTGRVETFIQLTAGAEHTCGVAADGGAWCWGSNDSGQLGTGTDPVAVPTMVLAGAFTLPEEEQDPGGPPAGPSPSPTPVPELVVPRVPGVGGGSIDGQETSLEVRPVVVDDLDTTPVAEGQQPSAVEVAGEVDGNRFAVVVEPAEGAGERGSGTVIGTELRLSQGEGVQTRLFGFAPNSQASLSIFSEPRELGTFTTDGAGNLAAAVELLPDDISACQHTVQVTGTLTGGQQMSAELGVWVLADPFPFADVATVSTHAPAIGCLNDLDGIIGFDGGDYDQQQPTTRGQAATILVRLLGLDPTEPSFADAGATHAGSIGALEAAGILNGHTDGTVRPHTPLTRGQAANLLANAAGLADDPDAAAGFADAGTTHAGALGALLAADGISGFGDDTLRPDQPVTRGQYATMVVRLRDLLQPDPDNTTTD